MQARLNRGLGIPAFGPLWMRMGEGREGDSSAKQNVSLLNSMAHAACDTTSRLAEGEQDASL
eukprot:scaffold96137_cov35-Tisochrysis_lutea.AAC.1